MFHQSSKAVKQFARNLGSHVSSILIDLLDYYRNHATYVCMPVRTNNFGMYVYACSNLVSSIFLCSSASSLCCLDKKNKKTKGSQLLEHFRHSTGATYLAGKVLENVKFWPSQPVESYIIDGPPCTAFYAHVCSSYVMA